MKQANLELHVIIQRLRADLRLRDPHDHDGLAELAKCVQKAIDSIGDYALHRLAVHMSPFDLLSLFSLIENVDQRLKHSGGQIARRS